MAVSEIDVRQLAALGQDAFVVDVRELDEWDDGHMPHAVHIPLAAVSESLHRFTGSPTFVVCRTGARSLHACQFADGHGADVVNVTGGMVAWEDAGFAVVRGAGSADDG